MSSYAAFDLVIQSVVDNVVTRTPVPLETVKVYDVTNDEALDDLESDANGHVGAGTLDVDAGTVIRFSFHTAKGLCGFSEVVTT